MRVLTAVSHEHVFNWVFLLIFWAYSTQMLLFYTDLVWFDKVTKLFICHCKIDLIWSAKGQQIRRTSTFFLHIWSGLDQVYFTQVLYILCPCDPIFILPRSVFFPPIWSEQHPNLFTASAVPLPFRLPHNCPSFLNRCRAFCCCGFLSSLRPPLGRQLSFWRSRGWRHSLRHMRILSQPLRQTLKTILWSLHTHTRACM